MRATALGYAVDYASVIARISTPMDTDQIVTMAQAFMTFLAHSMPDEVHAAEMPMPVADPPMSEPSAPATDQPSV